MITKTKLLKSFSRFDKGEHPIPRAKPKRWFVQFNSTLYPLKHIYSLATGLALSKFHTNTAKREFENLGLPIINITTLEEVEESFEKAVRKSIANPKTRNENLQNKPIFPKQQLVLQRVYLRNPYVVAEVLLRANGICERCKTCAPFKRLKDGSPYLEVHHKQWLANGGKDTIENAVAICPNCHRELHHG